MTSARGAAAAGIVSAMVGLAAGDLIAALLQPEASPVVAVGAQVIDLTPTPIKEWAIARFGTADKPILVSGVALVVLACAAFAGVTARHRMVVGIGIFAALGVIAGVVAVLRPECVWFDVVPAIVTSVVAIVALTLFLRAPRTSAPADGRTRRAVLAGSAALIVAGVTELVARRIVGLRTSLENVALPPPRQRIPALPAGLDLPGITPFRTSNRDFYRVDTRLTLPTVDVGAWRLIVDGRVERPVTLTFGQIADMELIERDITLTCVSNDVGGRYVGAARWLGVRLTDVLDRVGVREGTDQILSTDVDGMTISTPLAIAADGRDSMIVIGMNGEPLPLEHGFPARLLVPGLYGFVGATKWIARMTLTTYAEQDAYWTKRGWATDAPIKPSSRIDTPRPFQTVRAGEDVTIGGVAWAQNSGGVAGVEVSIDDGPWRSAVLGSSGGRHYWRQWYLTWRPNAAGSHTIAARAVSRQGRIQSARRAPPFPSGSSGIQRLNLVVDQSDRPSASNSR